MSNTNTIRFFYNGIKASDGKLQKCHYSIGNLRNFAEDTLSVYGKNYRSFSREIREALKVTNDSDSQQDYFANDIIRLESTHPLYAAAHAAYLIQESRRSKRAEAVAA